MIKNLLLVCFLFTFIACQKTRTFEAFDFSYEGTFETDFSIRFTDNDSVYLREHWNAYDLADSSLPKADNCYLAILKPKQRDTLDRFLKNIDFQKFKDRYYEEYSDGDHYQLYIKRKGLEKMIYVRNHSDTTKYQLDSLAYWIVQTKRSLKLVKIPDTLRIKSRIISPPPPPLPDSLLYLNNLSSQ